VKTALALLAAFALPLVAAERPENVRAVRLLLKFANQPMNTASCQKSEPGGKPLTIGEDLAAYFAEFDKGENRIRGQCKGAECSVDISHRNGEDVFSAVYRFRVTKAGVPLAASLFCGWTP
jgi:hypothetical protein